MRMVWTVVVVLGLAAPVVLGQEPRPAPVLAPAAVSPNGNRNLPNSASAITRDAGTTQPGPSDPSAPSGSSAGENTGANAGGGGEDNAGSVPTSGNPAAVDIIAGTGALGRLLGLGEDSGIRLGGLWIGDAS